MSNVWARRVAIVNVTKRITVAARAAVAVSAWDRTVGLLGRAGLDDNEALWLAPCSSIHCFFMKFTIDLIFLDRAMKITKLVPRVRPWRLAFGTLKTRSVVELPANALQRLGCQVGDQLAVVKTQPGQAPAA